MTQILHDHTQIQQATACWYQQNEICVPELLADIPNKKANNQANICLKATSHWLKSNPAELHDKVEQK